MKTIRCQYLKFANISHLQIHLYLISCIFPIFPDMEENVSLPLLKSSHSPGLFYPGLPISSEKLLYDPYFILYLKIDSTVVH